MMEREDETDIPMKKHCKGLEGREEGSGSNGQQLKPSAEGEEKEDNVFAAAEESGRMLKQNQNVPPSPVPEMVSSAAAAETKSKKKPEYSIYKLPEEIWELILGNEVKEDEDKLSCCRASSYLDTILTKSKPVWQFKMVLSDVKNYLPKTDLLNSRLVCKQWKTDIDNNSSEKEPNPIMYDSRNSFSSIAEIDACLQRFAGHPGNPFLDRTLHFSNGRDERDFAAKIAELLVRFGRHIWYMRLRNLNIGPTGLLVLLRRGLKRTPNLRQLIIDGFVFNTEGWDARMRLALSIPMLQAPFPILPQLRTLWFRPFVEECLPLVTMLLLPYITQLKSLSISMTAWKGAYSRGLVNLETVFLMDVSSDDVLRKLLPLNGPIRDLMLLFPSSPKISLSLIIKVLCNLPVLEKMNLCLQDDAELVDPEGEAVSLINRMRNKSVKYFQISHGRKFSYEFLKIFPSLEWLNVGFSNVLEAYVGGEKEEGLQFYKMLEEDQPYQSNMWRELPKLDRVDILHHHNATDPGFPERQYQYLFRRDVYEDYQKFKSEGNTEALGKVCNGKLI